MAQSIETGGPDYNHLRLLQRAERDRVPELLGRRDRVLPRPSRLARQHVAGSWREVDLPYAAALALSALEAQPRLAEQRDPDHDPERWRVPVPADRRATWISLDERLD